MKLIFATNNPKKLEEVKALLATTNIELLSLKGIGFEEDIPEPYDNLTDNALEKARVIHQKFAINSFADDTGLEIEGLNGEPGVYSARYAGAEKSAQKNMDLVLNKMEGMQNRKAAFRTVIALVWKEQIHTFEGIVEGIILTEKKGKKGFGYDPIFQPNGYDCSFAELSAEKKNAISHRGRAVRKLVNFLIAQSTVN